MMRNQLVLVLVAATGLSGCNLIKAATADKPNSRQTDAIGDIFSQVGTIAGIANDPGSTSNSDLVEAMTFGAFVHLVRPDTAPNAPPSPVWALPSGPPPGCIVSSDSSLDFDCDVTIPDGRHCNVAGSLIRTGGAATNYKGQLTLAGADSCPTATADIDIDYVEEPLLASGTFEYSYKDPPAGDDFSGSATFGDIGFASGCDLPSKGDLSVSASGKYHNDDIDDSITVSFNSDPSCGIVYIE